MKRHLKKFLRYKPLAETALIREAIESKRIAGYPYCRPEEGDLLYLLLQEGGRRDCLEMGFHTGSTALYMAKSTADRGGHVTSVCIDNDADAARGEKLLRENGVVAQHRLLKDNSNRALPELFLAGEKFDLVFMDGWKTFDHLAMEIYFINQVLRTGGAVVFDDSYMPSVRQVIRLIKRYYGYAEVDYKKYRQKAKLRVSQIITYRTPHRPYRALIKLVDTADQTPINDWHFFRSV